MLNCCFFITPFWETFQELNRFFCPPLLTAWRWSLTLFFLSVCFSTPVRASVTKATSKAPPSLKALWDIRPHLSKAPSTLISLTATKAWKHWRLALIHEHKRRSRCHFYIYTRGDFLLAAFPPVPLPSHSHFLYTSALSARDAYAADTSR